MRRVIPEEVWQRAAEMLQNGAKCNDVAQETGVHVTTIRRWKKELGLTKPRQTEETTDLVIRFTDSAKDRFAATAKFYGFNTTSQLVISVLNEKYYEAKDEIDALSTRERLQREYNEEYRALRQKYAELFRKGTE